MDLCGNYGVTDIGILIGGGKESSHPDHGHEPDLARGLLYPE